MKIIVLPRGLGKTTELIKWVLEGKDTAAYPFWSRVIVTVDIKRANLIREILHKSYPDKDVYRWIFSWHEWDKAYIEHNNSTIELAIDDIDYLLSTLLRFSWSNIKLATATLDEHDM